MPYLSLVSTKRTHGVIGVIETARKQSEHGADYGQC